MTLPFDLPPDRLPVIVPAPRFRRETSADGTVVFVPYDIRYLDYKCDRGLFEIDFMLNVRQFAVLKAAEWFTIFALVRRLKFSDKLQFPELRDTGKLHFVEGSNNKLVWATIPSHVIVTRAFTALDLHDERMALDEPAVIREAIERATQGSPNANIDAQFERFAKFKTPHRTDINRALKQLPLLGIVREYIRVDSHQRRAVMNPRMIAATRSGILRGIIAAEEQLRRCSGSTIEYSVDIGTAEPPAERRYATASGKLRYITRSQYQARFHAEHEIRIALERDGYLTTAQYAGLQRAMGAPELPGHIRSELADLFETARTDRSGTIQSIKDTEQQ